jgi:hypothetical protein
MLHGEDWHYEGNDESYEEFTPAPGLRPAKTIAKTSVPKPPAAAAKPIAKSSPSTGKPVAPAKPAPAAPAAKVMPTRAGIKPAPQARNQKLKNFAWHSSFVYTEKGTLKTTAGNVALILNYDPMWRDVLAYDEFADCIVTTKKPPWAKYPHLIPARGVNTGDWTDDDTIRLAAYLGMDYQLSVTSAVAYEGAMGASKVRAIHPVCDWLRGLKTSPVGSAWGPRTPTRSYAASGSSSWPSWQACAAPTTCT